MSSELLSGYFTQIFRIFGVTSPYFDLKYWEIFVGLFIISLGVKVFRVYFNPDNPYSISNGKEKRIRNDYLRGDE